MFIDNFILGCYCCESALRKAGDFIQKTLKKDVDDEVCNCYIEYPR